MTRSPQSSLAWRLGFSIFTRVAFASACVALAIWGKRFCHEVVASVAAPNADPGLNRLAAELSWALFFGPFFLLGAFTFVRVCSMLYRPLLASRSPEAPDILPPWPGAAKPPREAAPGRFPAHLPANEPLDDATRRRLDQWAMRAARVTGIAVGGVFVGLGLAGFVAMSAQEYRPIASGGLIAFGLILRFLIICGVFVLVGAYILRETFAQTKAGWLVPLRVFTAIASRKLREEELRRKVDEDSAGGPYKQGESERNTSA